MSRGAVLATTVGSLLLLLLVVLLVWRFVLDDVDRFMVLMLWGTLTGTGSLGGQ